MGKDINKILNEYIILTKKILIKKRAIRNKKVDLLHLYEETKNSTDQSIIDKRNELCKALKTKLNELDKLETARKVLETQNVFTISIGELVSELNKVLKCKHGDKLEVNIDSIPYPWDKIDFAIIEDNVNKGKYKAEFHVNIFNSKSCEFFFNKKLELSPSLTFSDNSTLKENLAYDLNSSTPSIKFKDINKIAIPFTLKDLFKKNDAWDVVKLRKAVVKCHENKNSTM